MSPLNDNELGLLRSERPSLLSRQFNLARGFYRLPVGDPLNRQGENIRNRYRELTQTMAQNALDLALPNVVDNMRDHGLQRIALVAPLRGALAIVTPQTVQHLEKRIRELHIGQIPVLKWAQGIKRDPKTKTTEMYFESGYTTDQNPDNVHAVICDWGTALGLTNEAAAHELYDYGIPFENMTILSMTIAPDGVERIARSCPGINIEASTNAGLNNIGYIDRIFDAEHYESTIVTPKDWGDELWGMKEGTPPDEMQHQIDVFMKQFAKTFRPTVGNREIDLLRSYYVTKYLHGQH